MLLEEGRPGGQLSPGLAFFRAPELQPRGLLASGLKVRAIPAAVVAGEVRGPAQAREEGLNLLAAWAMLRGGEYPEELHFGNALRSVMIFGAGSPWSARMNSTRSFFSSAVSLSFSGTITLPS